MKTYISRITIISSIGVALVLIIAAYSFASDKARGSQIKRLQPVATATASLINREGVGFAFTTSRNYRISRIR